MKYLVLGSAGQIGAELCKFLKNNGNEVIEFDIVNSTEEDLRIPDVLVFFEVSRTSDVKC